MCSLGVSCGDMSGATARAVYSPGGEQFKNKLSLGIAGDEVLAGPIIAVVCVAINVVTSLLTPAMDEAEVAKVSGITRLHSLKGRSPR